MTCFDEQNAVLARGRALAASGDRDALFKEALALAPTRLADASAYRLFAGDAAAALDGYTRWLAQEERPGPVHLSLLAKAALAEKAYPTVYQAAAAVLPFDLTGEAAPEARLALSRAVTKARRALGGPPPGFKPFKLAYLATFNPAPILPALSLGALRLKVDLDLFTGDFDQLRALAAAPDSALYAFGPKAIVVATTWRDLRPNAPADAQADEWLSLYQRLAERSGAQILAHTFDRPAVDPLGHLSLKRGLARLAAEVNQRLAERGPPQVSLVDLPEAAAQVGRAFFDERQWHWAKEAVTAEGAPALVEAYLAVLRPLLGKSAKVLVLDLDHTLWGGVVGEDGITGLKVGPPSPEGEAHQALQRYAKALKAQGVLLAVCSKNNPEDAREPFTALPDMVLALDDFVAFDADWTPKPDRLRALAARLNLGLDALVFVDDNPAERALMRHLCPEVLTVPLPDDPAGYVAALHAYRPFEALSLSEEDAARTAQYQAEAARCALSESASSPDAYHRSLEMVATVRPFNPGDLQRVVQLAARSNQFNLTTTRLSAAEVEALAASPAHFTRSVRLRDRFGDYGLVAVVVGEIRADALHITTWLMSCRVIARTVEELTLSVLEAGARALGLKALTGEYRPTAKNALVADLYPRLGFTPEGERDGVAFYRRALDGPPTVNPFIALAP